MSVRRIRDYLNYSTGRAKYLFIHIPKNAGVAMRKCPQLQGRLVSAEPGFHKSRAYTRELKRTMDELGEHHGYQHARLIDLHPRVRWALRPVAVIRNPWARVVSRFRFAELAMQQGSCASEYSPRSFEAFLEERHQYGGKPFFWHRAIRGWYPQVDYVRDEQGQLAAHLLRQEHLSQESQAYFQMTCPVAPRNVSANSHSDYRACYTPRTIQIVADWYAADIETFGFDFDTAATRNVYFAKDRQAERAAA